MSRIKSLLKTLGYRAAVASGLPRRRRARDGGAAVFCFHNVVADGPDALRGDRSLHVERRDFAEYARWIAGTYDVVPLREIVARLATGRPIAGLAAVTFDDAYRGVFRHALPELAALGLPSTIFVVSRASTEETTFWWDRVSDTRAVDAATLRRCLEELRGDADLIDAAYPSGGAPLPDDFHAEGWAGIERSLAGGVEIGVHTVTHRNLAVLSDAEVRDELATCRDAIERRLGVRASLVAYPYGGMHDGVAAATRALGFAGAVSMAPGFAPGHASPFAVPRVNVPAGISRDALECRAAGLQLNA